MPSGHAYQVAAVGTDPAHGLLGQSTGGPVINLSGQVVAIGLSGSAHGPGVTSYAVPINEALAVAQQLKH